MLSNPRTMIRGSSHKVFSPCFLLEIINISPQMEQVAKFLTSWCCVPLNNMGCPPHVFARSSHGALPHHWECLSVLWFLEEGLSPPRRACWKRALQLWVGHNSSREAPLGCMNNKKKNHLEELKYPQLSLWNLFLGLGVIPGLNFCLCEGFRKVSSP